MPARNIGDRRLGLLAEGMVGPLRETTGARSGTPQTRLFHQRQHLATEEFEIRREVEEGDLYPVAAGPLKTDQLVHNIFGAADDLDVAPESAVFVAMSLPGDSVARSLMCNEAFDRTVISRIEDSLVVALRVAVGLAANDHRVDDRANLPATLGSGGFDQRVMRR